MIGFSPTECRRHSHDCYRQHLLGIAFHRTEPAVLRDVERYAEQERIVVSKLRSALDVSEFHARISEQEVQINRLIRSGMGTNIAESQLLELKETLAHLQHHQAILSFSVSRRSMFIS